MATVETTESKPRLTTSGPIIALVLSAVSLLSLALPLVAPVVALLCGVPMVRLARRSGSGWAWVGVAVCATTLAIALTIDLGLIKASSAQSGVPKVAVQPS